MKKLSVILSLVIASFLFFTTSCGTSSSSSPADISKKIPKYIEKGNVDAFIAVLSTDGKELSDEDKAKLTAMLQMGQEEIKKKDGIKSIEVIEEDINEAGDEATVNLKIIYGNGEEDTETYKFAMEDGKWKYLMN
ncbi:MAG: DUF4878 domain-containing protein [Bacteroidales bacterium]|nr:DUF4878 domain-containing protein [Bacteroidales bacterium]